jgi:PAS domain S-box-containing protein
VVKGAAGLPDSLFGALESSPDATLVLDGAARIIFANGACARLFGTPVAALVGTPLGERIAVDCRPWLADALGTFLGVSRPGDHHERHDRAGDRELRALRGAEASFPIELALGRRAESAATFVVAVIRDLSDAGPPRGLRIPEPDEARSRLKAMLAFAPAFIVAVSRDGRIEYINRIMSQYREADVIGSSWLQYFAPERQEVMKSALRAVFETGITQIYETTTPGPDGLPVWFSSQIAAIREGGETVGAVLVSQDITTEKRTQAELAEARQMALLGTMAAGVAHEINTPIQFIGDSINFLRDAGRDLLSLIGELQALRAAFAAGQGMRLDEAIAAAARAEGEADLPYIRENMPLAFERCVDGLERVATIVHSLKEFSHPLEKEMKAVDLNHTIESILTIARGEYKYVADLETDLAELPPVMCHAGEIGQVILNIVVNAAHAIGDVVRGSDRKGLITVRSRPDGDSVVIAISDTGGGIPEAVRGRIFDPFFTTKAVGAGTGQGLTIAWAKVKDQHGGELRFETEMGKGTTFFIRLPVAGKV